MAEKELDPNEEIEGTSDHSGFELPPLGDIKKGNPTTMVFSGEIKKCGKDEKSLNFELHWVDDESQKANMFIKTTSPQGLKRLVGIGNDSGAFKKINDKRIKAGKAPILSDKGTVKTKVLQNEKFHDQLRQEIAGCKVLCSVTHSPAKPWEDDDGVEHEGFARANVTKTAPMGSVEKSTKAATETEEAGAGKTNDAEDWEE